MEAVKKNTETLIDARKEVGRRKLKYMLLSLPQNAGQNQDMKIANPVFEGVSQFKYWGTTVINHNVIQYEIKKRLNSCNVCYHLVQSLLSSRGLSKR
jgi:hypothetical protein